MAYTQETFVEKFKQCHGDAYDLSDAVYSGWENDFTIKCPKHGLMTKLAKYCFSRKPCRYCSWEVMARKKTKMNCTEDFLKRVESKFQHLDFSNTVFVSMNEDIEVVCKTHGSFTTLPSYMLHPDKTWGCMSCVGENVQYKRMTNEEFIEKAKRKHGDLYSYDKTQYIRANQKVIITCHKHGDFLQNAGNHLSGYKCMKCANERTSQRQLGQSAPAHSGSGYAGFYKEINFRSLSELFWMLEQEKRGIEFIPLDQAGVRCKWQISYTINGVDRTYCADFYVPSTNTVIDIKPDYSAKMDAEKLKLGKEAYEKLGYRFELYNSNLVPINRDILLGLVESGEVKFRPKTLARLHERLAKNKRNNFYG